MRRSIAGLLAALLIAGCSTAQSTPAPTPVSTAVPTAAPTPTAVPTLPPTPEPTTDPLRLLIWQAALDTIETENVSILFDLVFNGNITVTEGARVHGDGAAAFGRPMRMVLAADYGALGLGELEIIVNDTLLYLKGDVLEALNLKTGKWLLVDLESNDPRAVPFKGITTGQNEMSLVMYYLFGAESPIETLAPQKVGGVVSQHYGMSIDLDLAVEIAPETSRENLKDNVAALRTGGVNRTVAGEVWIDPDGLVRRVTYIYTVGAVSGGGTMHVTYTFSDFGDPLDLSIPAKANIVALEDLPS